jgi:heterodisulfide reductase subunit D
LRGKIVAADQGPEFVGMLKEMVETEHNVFDFPNEERAEWAEFMADAPEHLYKKDRAEVLYYVGCVSSFSPAAQELPKSFAKIMEMAGVDFSILGGDEWCCGFPLMVAGLKKEAEELKRHNIEQMKKLGAKTVVFNCPSCYHMWAHEYDLEGVSLMHSTQLLAKLIEQGAITLGGLDVRVTYHDPCDLGRNSGVYEEPRKVIKAIPGIELVELMHSREEGFCCGGGGDFEMLKPDMTQAISTHLIREVERLKADMVVVACPQCKRMELNGVEALDSKVRVLDITELIMEAGIASNHEKAAEDIKEVT